MSNLEDTRSAVAAAINGLSGFNIVSRGARFAPKPLDGFVRVQRVAPMGFRTCDVEFGVVVCLGTDPETADVNVDTYTVALIDGISSALPAAALAAQPVLFAGPEGEFFALEITFTLEVDS